MKSVELYARVRFAVQIEGISRREGARRFGIDPRTVANAGGFGAARIPAEPAAGASEAGRLAADEGRPRKQRHTVKRIFERLRDEHGYRGGITIVRDYVRVHRLQHHEVFVPLRHNPVTRRWILARRWRRSPGVERKSTFLRWTCRTEMLVLCRPIRRRPPKRSATGTMAMMSRRFRRQNAPTLARWTMARILAGALGRDPLRISRPGQRPAGPPPRSA